MLILSKNSWSTKGLSKMKTISGLYETTLGKKSILRFGVVFSIIPFPLSTYFFNKA